MNTGLKDIIKNLCQKKNAENLTHAVRLIQYIFSHEEEENVISEYFSWFKKMPTFYRQEAIERTKKMVEMAIENEPWKDTSGNQLTEHMEILAAILVSQSQYHYDILHELRNKDKFIEEICDLFKLKHGSRENICKYAQNIYLPGQIDRQTAPENKSFYGNDDYSSYIEKIKELNYQPIIDVRRISTNKKESLDWQNYKVKKIWHYVRNIPQTNRVYIVQMIENIIKKIFPEVKHVAVHRPQRNIFDLFFLSGIESLAKLENTNEDISANEVIPKYLWQLGDNKGEMVLRKISIENEPVFILESYLGKINLHDNLRDIRDFPGIKSDIIPLNINYYKLFEENKPIDKNDDFKRMVLKMVEAIVASTFKTKKFDFDNNKRMDYYDYYYLPYPVIRYIFNYFSCLDIDNEFFLTMEFKREDFQGLMEGDMWISIPNMKKIEEIFGNTPDMEITTLTRLLKSISYRYIIYTISLMAVTVGFKNLSINIKKSNEDIRLDETSYEEDYLVKIADEIGCRPLYTKYISDFQYKPSQVKLRKAVSKIELGMNCLSFKNGKPALFVGIDIGGTNIKIRFFTCHDSELEEVNGSFFSIKTFGKAGENGSYHSSEDFVKYIADEISRKYNGLGLKSQNQWSNIYVGISFPGPVYDNQLAGISGVVRKLDKKLEDIQPERQILDSHIDIIQQKVKIVEPLKEKLKEAFSKLKVTYNNIFVNMTNDGTAEGIGHLHKFFEETQSSNKINKDNIEFDYIIVLKAGTGTAGAVLKKEKEYFVLEEGPCEFGKLVVNIMKNPRSFEINDCDKIFSYILGKGAGEWPGINRYISQSGLNNLLKVLNNEEMFGKMKNLTSEEIGKMIELTGVKTSPYQRQAQEAAKRLGYMIADTVATIKIIYKIPDEANVGLILSGGVLPQKNGRATGDSVIEGVIERLNNIHGICLTENSEINELKNKNWTLLPDMSEKEPELGCRGCAIYSLLKENIKIEEGLETGN